MNRDRLLADAKAKALSLVEDYQPPERDNLYLPGKTAQAALEMAVAGFRRLGLATPHDMVVAKHLAFALSGGRTDHLAPLSDRQMLALEKEQFLQLARLPDTQARVSHILKTGKPLRN